MTAQQSKNRGGLFASFAGTEIFALNSKILIKYVDVLKIRIT
jgi:hypothetical protein